MTNPPKISIVSPAYFIMRVPLVFNGTQLVPSCANCRYASCEHVTWLCSNTGRTPPFGVFDAYEEAFPFFSFAYTSSIANELQRDDFAACQAGTSWPYHAYLVRSRLIRGARARFGEVLDRRA